MGVFDQLVGLADPDRATPAFQPIVEHDPGDLAAFARSCAVAQKPAAAKADGVRGVIRGSRKIVECFVDGPRALEMRAMRLAGVDDAFQLGVGEQARCDEGSRQMRAIARLRRRDRGHGGRLHKACRMRRRAENADRLQEVFVIERRCERADGGGPIDGLVGEFDRGNIPVRCVGSAGCRADGDGSWRRVPRHRANSGRRGNVSSEWKARRDIRLDPREQRSGVWRQARGGHERFGILGGDLVDYREARFDRGSLSGEHRAVDRGGENDLSLLLQLRKRAIPGRVVGRKARPRDGDEPPART